jgi:serine/threonine-protein kinase
VLACQTAEVRKAVDELLACASDGAELEQSVRNAALLALKPVDRAGPYRLERPLGQGGMGTVYLAHRADDAFEKRVAVKFVHQAVDSPMLRRRFEEERRILARLEHPYIARLLDAGATADGRPWLAMEYVEGESIVSYVTARSISLSARIDLLIRSARLCNMPTGTWWSIAISSPATSW